MTRINAGIDVKQLSDRHLLAEHREIKRLPNHLKKHGWSKNSKVPDEFVLGKGHVKFFIPLGMFTFKRYLDIYYECKNRNFNVTDYRDSWDIYNKYPTLYNDYLPTEKGISLLLKRIKERS